MKPRNVWTALALLTLASLVIAGFWSVSAQETRSDGESSVLLRLKYATFDPLDGEPDMPPNLRLDAYAKAGAAAYIVQFRGPIEEEWPAQIEFLGARLVDYIPDYAFLVWMDGQAQAKIENLKQVRWVGLYQPAYKLSPNLDPNQRLYRVALFEELDQQTVESRLEDLNTPTTRVAGKVFTLALPEGETRAGIETVAAWPEVLWIENQPAYRLQNDVGGGIMNAPAAWSSGYTGSGMIVTVADSGIDSGVDTPSNGDMHPDFDNRMTQISSWPVQDDGCSGCCYANVGADDGPADRDSGHGTHVLGSVGGNGKASSGQFKGPAFEASLTFQAVEQWVDFGPDCGEGSGYEVAGIPPDISQLFSEAYGWGSRVHSNSWGAAANGEYTTDSRNLDQFLWSHPSMVILFSAGNSGVDTNSDGYVDMDSIDSPASAKNGIAVGASENVRSAGGYNPGGACTSYGNCWPDDFPANPTKDDFLSDDQRELAAFSGRGPTDDGRLKPDVVGPGTNILSARSTLISSDGWGAHANPYYMYMGGTSMSTPLIAGTAALVREYYVEGLAHGNPSAALVKATLINSAIDIAGYGNASHEAGLTIPNNHEGWGRVDVGAATSGNRIFHDWDSVTTGINTSYQYQIGVSSVPLKVTLAWTDWPGALPAGGLVNDLDLRLISPSGAVYWGNNFSGGWSATGGSADAINNVESVYIQHPEVGQWTLRVTGANVPFGPQPFAIVATGFFGPPPNYDNSAFLPLVLKNPGSGPGGELQNGNFEAGPTAWTYSSSGGYDLIVDADYLPE